MRGAAARRVLRRLADTAGGPRLHIDGIRARLEVKGRC
jgi:hypothetical protein